MRAIDSVSYNKQPEPRATDPIFSRDSNLVEHSQLKAFIRHCEFETALTFADYAAFHKFSVTDFRVFWRLFLGWSSIAYDGDTEPVCVGDLCEQARFFPKLLINYAEILLRENGDPDRGCDQSVSLRWQAGAPNPKGASGRVERLAAFLQHTGVRPGDRIVVIARNGAEAIIAALAPAS